MAVFTEQRTDLILPEVSGHVARIHFYDSMFEYRRGQDPQISSGSKRVFVGRYVEYLHGGGFAEPIPSRAVEFPAQHLDSVGKECASLARANAVGVGPRIFQILASAPLDETDGEAASKGDADKGGDRQINADKIGQRAIIIEEDVGVNLDDAIFDHAAIPCDDGSKARPLSDIGTREREIENAKIKFDVFTQLYNLHTHGMFHRDMRAANVCVRRYGKAPEDIRATLIDFELVGNVAEHDVPKAAAPYVKALFGRGSHEGPGELMKVNPLEFDLGYLAAFCYELESEVRVADAGPDLLDGSRFPFFVNTGHGYLRVRSLSGFNLDDLAATARMVRVTEENLGSIEAVDLANSLVKHGGYLDRRDEEMLRGEPLSYILFARPRLCEASYETYKAARVKDGKPIEYESFEDQPEDLQALNLDLFASYPKKLGRFGLALARKGKVPASGTPISSWEELDEDEFEGMSEDEHDRWWALKEKQGWRPWVPEEPGEVYDKKSKAKYDAEKRSKDMVPYEELDDRTKEYDRKNVRNMFTYLEDIGLVVYRP